ncbi:MAG: transcriptional regulator [Sulfuricurvum sp. PD_MW2]|uniref:S24 family peptidase n=1 Tax=Sulfuricurvum sp. PD_MW2 TaxID=2027917 RepID=UPI000C0642B4|nr:S24 family peptidase [Sulfuricurvum sp. PD_MW2]PHM18073.1 MAG: transcriptional regulator [Sulfuricurvum sp. PD_MW2]
MEKSEKLAYKKEILEEMKEYFNVSSIEQVAVLLGFSEATASTWRSRGASDNAIAKFELIRSNDNANVDPNLLKINRVALKASAGSGNHLESIDKFDVVETMTISRSLLKTQPNGTLRLIGVDGYSMVPMLYPDSLVLFDEHPEWRGDGLYILNWRNELMVKLLQIDPHGKLHIKSVNKDYESWVIDPDDQSVFHIVGKVLRVII